MTFCTYLPCFVLASFAETMTIPCTRESVPRIFATMHTSFVRIHPFADGNGRMARLLANMLLLASGLPPLLIAKEARREYISLLGAYEQEAGAMTKDGDLLPTNAVFEQLVSFCANQWASTWEKIDKMWAVQKGR